ncbi:MAG: hypothetical protein MJ230_01505 [bacterium]|nr:hypothetical protein [bacterium]
MNEKNSDIFQSSSNQASTEKNNNFFLSNGTNSISVDKHFVNTQHLNDYDYNIMQKGAYKDIPDNALKIEYQISETEKNITDIETQIDLAREMADYDKYQELQGKLIILKENYKNLLSSYNEQALSAKISTSVFNVYDKIIGSNFLKLKNLSGNIYEKLLALLPDKFGSIVKIKKSLSALENINKSVDNLVSMDIPYGESIDKYKKLSKYIIKANSIQSDISKYIKRH